MYKRQELNKVRREAQHEVNALAARLAELQAQANRLNALGARLTQSGQLQDGEFEFDKPVGQGGAGRASDCLLYTSCCLRLRAWASTTPTSN